MLKLESVTDIYEYERLYWCLVADSMNQSARMPLTLQLTDSNIYNSI